MAAAMTCSRWLGLAALLAALVGPVVADDLSDKTYIFNENIMPTCVGANKPTDSCGTFQLPAVACETSA